MVGRGPIDIVHDQALAITEARLAIDLGLWRSLGFSGGVSLMLPVRAVGSSIRYLDMAGAEVELERPGIHHRDEVVSGLGDPIIAGSVARALGGWRVTARVGAAIPLGRTEEDPFVLGDAGIAHQHIQLGTGTLNPVLGVEVARGWGDGRWRFGGFALTQQVLYENGEGYQAGDRYAGGVSLRRQLGPAWSVRGGIEAQGETAERWGGIVQTDDGNRGRFDLIGGVGATWAATRALSVELAAKVPVVTYAVGGQLDMPVIAELGVAWTLGARPAAPARKEEEEHGHSHEGEDGHGHSHEGEGEGEGAAAGEDEGAGGAAQPAAGEHGAASAAAAAAGADVADLGKPGEAVDLAPVPGKLTIYDFWAAWCVPCKELEPALVELARRYPAIVALRRIDTVDWETPVVARYLTPRGFGLPHVKVVDAAGRVVLERSSGAGGLAELIAAVRELVEAEARARATPAPR